MNTTQWAEYLAGSTGLDRLSLTDAATRRATQWAARVEGTSALLDALTLLQEARALHSQRE